ncbi:amidohydrolase [Microbulbifer variabilis]|uniref:amidohydrolase n=1 Tax=Microbulbifer variabilis TaxID=266805 RepID=UPI001CFE4D70|nr:amidohydrolase family protein [Microbulbifer variabilis]
MRWLSLLSILLLLSCDSMEKSTSSVSTLNQPAQLIVRNATIYTADKVRSIASAMAIRDGRIIFVGNEADVESYIGTDTKIADLNGRLVLPGFFQRAKIRGSASRINLFSENSIEDYHLAVSRYIRENPEQQVIVGDGWSMQAFSAETPHKGILDQINDLIPIILFSSDRSSIWTNSEGLAAAGINNDSENPVDGFIEKNEHGIATGWLRGSGAVALMEKLIPEYPKEVYRRDLLCIQELAASNGVTTLYEPAIYLKDEEARRRYFDTLSDIDSMDIRVQASIVVRPTFTEKDFSLLQQEISQIPISDFNLSSISFIEWLPKTFRTWITEEALDGESVSLKKVAALAQRAHSYQFSLQILVSGKEGTIKAWELLEELEGAGFGTEVRNAVVNAYLGKESALEGLSKVHSAAFVQPETIFALNVHPGDSMTRRHIKESDRYLPLGVSLLSSDFSQINGMVSPLLIIHRGVNHDIPIFDLVEAFTINAAYAGNLEKETGSIEKGKWADFIVLDRNIFKSTADQIDETRILKTFYKGRLVFDRNSVKSKSLNRHSGYLQRDAF